MRKVISDFEEEQQFLEYLVEEIRNLIETSSNNYTFNQAYREDSDSILFNRLCTFILDMLEDYPEDFRVDYTILEYKDCIYRLANKYLGYSLDGKSITRKQRIDFESEQQFLEYLLDKFWKANENNVILCESDEFEQENSDFYDYFVNEETMLKDDYLIAKDTLYTFANVFLGYYLPIK